MKNLLYVFSLVMVLFGGVANAGGPINTKGEGSAIHGYDTVAYFTESKPVKGSSKYAVEYKGAQWLFSSAKNKALFEANAEKYAPQYGGHCAFAAAHDNIADTDPNAWHITDGKLFLNYNKDVQKRWLPNKKAFIPKADAFWKTLK